MTDASALAEPSPPRPAPSRNRFEQWMFDLSPFGTLLTSILIFLFLAGTLAGTMALDHLPIFDPAGKVLGLSRNVWPALVLSLLIVVVLGTQRWVRSMDEDDAVAYRAIFHYEAGNYPEFLDAPTKVRLRNANIAGVIVGLILVAMSSSYVELLAHPFSAVWFVFVEVYVSLLIARGVVLSTRSSQMFDRSIQHDLVIDLLRIDLLNVIGRNRARTSLIWFAVAAAICLFFVGDNMAASTFLTLAFSAGMGLWTFLRPMERVHRRIRHAKDIELERVRKSISGLREQAVSHADAATRLQGLLAYEKRIEDVREWPFDQTTALRLSAYIFIPAIPWFGQAIAQSFVERMAH
jgi:hypothetical protein